MIGLSNRVHLFAHPDIQEKLTEFFTSVLECEAVAMPGTSIVLFRFSNNAALTVDFTQDALDERQARRGAWLEVKTDDPVGLQKKALDAGLPQVEYSGSGRFYFQAPGGQVWGILSSG